MLRNVFVYGANGAVIEALTAAVVGLAGLEVVETADRADLALAPLLRRKLSPAEWTAPRIGTLVFHPSLLPLHRGPDAVKWAALDRDMFTGATWFWCAEALDAGDICEQELVAIPPGATPREVYETVIVPAAGRTLTRALAQLKSGYVRRVRQDEGASTYESWHPQTLASRGDRVA